MTNQRLTVLSNSTDAPPNVGTSYWAHLIAFGKMRDEAAFLTQEGQQVLTNNGYCHNKYDNDCKHNDNNIYYNVSCDGIVITVYNVEGREILKDTRSKIISEIAKKSTFNVYIYFYNGEHNKCFFCLFRPSTEAFINRE